MGCIRIETAGENYKRLHRKRLWIITDGTLSASSKNFIKIIWRNDYGIHH